MLNSVQLIGRLGFDPEIRKTQSSDTVANLRIATNERRKDKNTGVKAEKTEWHNVVMWSKLADIAGSYLKKGSLVHITGKLQTRKWEKDGVDHYTTEIIASSLIMLDKRDDSEAQQ